MAKYLISFPAAAMVVPADELEAVGRDASAVIDATKAAGVHVFAGGLDEGVAPVRVSADGSLAAGGRPPKGVDVAELSQIKLNVIARQLNERPRKTLGFLTPAEMFSECVALTG